ncbi:GntR family transcriptional regulator [Sulfurovum lithotrophicum]|uniref:GntR family transcriptional regulator n=1 Tax=Sulfurovum lithotrophicum TaxID=206403 RepID=A0A7U4RRK3_9BACT|nr:DoxX family protein [Sulfurovum lithotrophicum]AKF25866.1 GntR family transcriptional regulator [Sulfurovum lithotrophicum]
MSSNIGKLLLRLMLGGLLLFHGLYKLQHGIGSIKSMVVGHGLPEVLAYGVYVGEILAPLLLILGVYSRVWAGVIVLNMLMAVWLTNFKGMLGLGAFGAWEMETTMFYLLTALAITLLGSGKYAIRRD